MINIDALTSVIEALRVEERPDSISPEVLGAVLQQIADLINGAGSDDELDEIADQIAALGVTDTTLLDKINQEITDRKASIKEVVNRRANNKFSFRLINALTVDSTESAVKAALKTDNFPTLNPMKIPDDYVEAAIRKPQPGDMLYNSLQMVGTESPSAIVTEAASKSNNWFSFSYEYGGKRKTIKISEAYKVLSVTELVITAELDKKVESEGYDLVVGDLEANLLSDAIRKTPQVLSAAEQKTARGNIGAQGALSTSADLALRDDVLSLTDMAKKRLFIDLWNECAVDFGRYNEETGYFELNGLTDLTWDDALMIYEISANTMYPNYANTDYWRHICGQKGKFRTNLPSLNLGAYGVVGCKVSTYLCEYIEVLNVFNRQPFNRPPSAANAKPFINSYTGMDLYLNRRLRKVMGYINIVLNSDTPIGYDLPYLEEIFLKGLSRSYKYFYKAPKLNYASVKYMIENRGGTNAITIWYHADVYNKILGTAADSAYEGSGGTKAEWMAIADLAASKNITLATE